MEDSSSAAAPKTPPILQLPDEVLCEILIAAGPSSAVRASKTCHRLHAILNTAATWKRFLATSGYPNHHEVEPEAARSVILEHYCRSCDTIVPRMFYTGNLCIACEYVQIKNEDEIYHCLGRVHRWRINQSREARLEASLKHIGV